MGAAPLRFSKVRVFVLSLRKIQGEFRKVQSGYFTLNPHPSKTEGCGTLSWRAWMYLAPRNNFLVLLFEAVHPEQREEFPALPELAPLRHIHRRLRAGKTVKSRRRRATVRREKIPRVPLLRVYGAGRPRGAVPPSQETYGVRNRESRKRSRTRGNP